MPLSVSTLQARLQPQISPGNDAEFMRILSEADERLLAAGRWHWTREPVTLTPDEDRTVQLSSEYESIVGCRLGSVPMGVVWQETEYLADGPGLIPIEGCSGRLVDQGLVDVTEEGSSDPPVFVRFYKVTDTDTLEVSVLARFAPKGLFDDEDNTTLCPSISALKQMMLSVIHEEANNIDLSTAMRNTAINTLNEHEAAYRGIAKEIFKPKLFRRLPFRKRHSFP